MNYFLYARKSSESEDRQIQSIDDQVKRLKELAEDRGFSIKRTFKEAKSAKNPESRPIFNEMMERVENGEADGILCWQINRLSRNPVDTGRIQWILQRGVLKSIRTIEKEYLPDDNALLLSIEGGMANQFIIDLKRNTLRGVISKLEKGWLPNVAPVGYLNDVATKTIVVDPERFDLVKKMWNLMLTGNYTPPKILEIATNEWGFRTRCLKRRGGSMLSKSGIYRIFNNPFYAGVIDRAGKRYEGKHQTMITIGEFERAQMLLGRPDKPKPKKHIFAFTGFIRCEECGCLYTAEQKQKTIKETGGRREYVYYHCTRKKLDRPCSQRKYIREDQLELQIEREIAKHTIMPEFRDWALQILNEKNDAEIEERKKIYETQHKTLVRTQKELDELTRIRYRGLIGDEEFIRQRKELKDDLDNLKDKLRATEERAERWLELTEKTFNFATYAHRAFNEGNLDAKREIARALGQNFTIRDGLLSIEANEWFKPIERAYSELENEYRGLEPAEELINTNQKEAFASLRSRWGVQRDSNPY